MSTSLENPSKLKDFEGKTFFYLGLSFRWGSEERRILKDSMVAKNKGARVLLYTYKDSLISEKAKALGIDCLYYQGKFPTKVYQWHKIKPLRKILRNQNVSVVHCYDIKILWPLCLYMRAFPLIPLVFTLTIDLKSYYRQFWYRALIERVDQVFLSMPEMVENVWGHIGIPPRKIDFIGLGMEAKRRNEEESDPPFKYHKDRWYLGASLNGIETNTKFLTTLFNALKVMVEKGLDGKGYTLALCNEKPWSESKLSSELRRQVKDMGLEDYVAFVEEQDVGKHQLDVDLWVGLSRREDLEDYSVQALINECPVIVPRTAFSMELLRNFGVIGETYRQGDSREIREKCETILRNISTYETNLHKANQGLRESYGEEIHQTELFRIYNKLINRRKRLQAMREKRKLRAPRKKPKNA